MGGSAGERAAGAASQGAWTTWLSAHLPFPAAGDLRALRAGHNLASGRWTLPCVRANRQ